MHPGHIRHGDGSWASLRSSTQAAGTFGGDSWATGSPHTWRRAGGAGGEGARGGG